MKSQAKLHFSAHAGHLYQCQHCEKTFVNRSSYFAHVRLAHAAQNVTCGECGEAFVSRLGFTLHYSKTHEAQKAASKCACASCGAAFDNAKALHKHAKTSCDPTARPCAACGASLPSDEALRTHTEECHKEFKCAECPLSFAGLAARDTHYRLVHSAPREGRPGLTPDLLDPARGASLVCPQCGKQCQNSTALQYHINGHLDVKPFQCHHCPKSFAHRTAIILHMRVHTGERPYKCKQCPMAFAFQGNFSRHVKQIHLKQFKRVECKVCGKIYDAATLAPHIRYVHQKQPYVRRKRDRKKRLVTKS